VTAAKTVEEYGDHAMSPTATQGRINPTHTTICVVSAAIRERRAHLKRNLIKDDGENTLKTMEKNTLKTMEKNTLKTMEKNTLKTMEKNTLKTMEKNTLKTMEKSHLRRWRKHI
jgi:TRAP-type uncharacterized transport system substrate-binding protein